MPNAVEPPTESPTRLEAAYALLADADGPPWRPLAGGTDLMVQVTGELGEPPERILDIWRLDELRGIAVERDALVIGALSTYTEIRGSPIVPAIRFTKYGVLEKPRPAAAAKAPGIPCRSATSPAPTGPPARPRSSAMLAVADAAPRSSGPAVAKIAEKKAGVLPTTPVAVRTDPASTSSGVDASARTSTHALATSQRRRMETRMRYSSIAVS